MNGVPISRIFKNQDFGYRTITVERGYDSEAPYSYDESAEEAERYVPPQPSSTRPRIGSPGEICRTEPSTRSTPKNLPRPPA